MILEVLYGFLELGVVYMVLNRLLDGFVFELQNFVLYANLTFFKSLKLFLVALFIILFVF